MDEFDEFIDLLSASLSLSSQEGLKFIQKQRKADISKASANGSLGNGSFFVIISELFENYLKIRSRTILTTINKVAQGFDLEATSQVLLESFCFDRLEQEKKDLIQEMLGHPPFKQSGFKEEAQLQRIIQGRLNAIEETYEQERIRLDTEIKLYFRRRKMASNDAKSGPVINISGSVQTLQVGDHNTVIIDQSQKELILDSFNQIREVLKDSDLIEATKYQDITELMNDCENELNKGNPNKSRIGAYLSTVGASISGIATLGSAYQALKTFVPLFGGPPLP